MNGLTAWTFLLVLGIMFIVMGFQGSMGKVVAVIFTPSILETT